MLKPVPVTPNIATISPIGMNASQGTGMMTESVVQVVSVGGRLEILALIISLRYES